MDYLFDFSEDFKEPKIVRAYNHDDLGDDPASHRWRASWYDTYDSAYGGHKVIGILLSAYPVLKATPTGAWIGKNSYRERRGPEITWVYTEDRRWVSNNSGSAFAKCTQDEALHSIAYRLMRWHQKTIRDVKRLREAAFVCNALLPELGKRYAKDIEGAF